MVINPIALMSLIAIFFVIPVAAYVYFQDPKNPLNKSYLRLSLMLVFWNLFQFLYRSSPTYDIAYVWLKIALFFGPLVAPFFLSFVFQFAGYKRVLKSWLFYVVTYGPILTISSLFSFTDLLIDGPVKIRGWFNTYAVGSRPDLFILSMSFIFILAFTTTFPVLLMWFRRPKSGIEAIKRKQARLIAIGVTLAAFSSVTTELILRAFGEQPILIGTWTSGLYAALIGYAITKYSLFQINPATAADNIVSTMTDSLVITNPESEILIANEATADMLGYTVEELRGKNITAFLEDDDKIQQIRDMGLKQKPIENYELKYVARDGRTTPILLSCSLIYGKRKELAGIVCVAKDITDRKIAEEANKKAQIKQAYSEVFYAATGEKFILGTPEEILKYLGSPLTDVIEISTYEDLSKIRSLTKEIIVKNFGQQEKFADIALTVSEGLTNAIKHAGKGSYQIFKKNDNLAQFMIADNGKGIDFKSLPKATLLSGFSTKGTLGVGFSVMLDLSDRVLLATDPGGTTLVLEVKF